MDALPSVGGLLPLMSRSSLHPFLLPPDGREFHVCIRPLVFILLSQVSFSCVATRSFFCRRAYHCLSHCVPFVLSSYFLHSQYVLPFPVALLRMIAILVHLVMGVCNYVERFFILLLSVFLRVEGVMDCQSVASAEVYHLSCILSFLCRSCSNWVMGCLLLLWRCTYHCVAVTVWKSGPRYCECHSSQLQIRLSCV